MIKYMVYRFFKKKREKMPTQLLAQIAANAANTGLGLLLEKHQDQRQLNQQDRLNQQQLGYDIQKMGAQKQMQLEMWKDTNYPAQMEQLNQAGLNPGLLYGMSGGGSATAGAGAAGVNANKAPMGGGEIMGLQMMAAQKALIEAQTEKTKVETQKTAGPDMDIATAEARIRKLQGQMTSDTYEATYGKAIAEWAKLEAEAQKLQVEGNVADATEQTQIKQREGELLGILMTNELKKEQINLTEAQTQATIEAISQKWKDLSLKEGKLDLERFVQDVANSTRLTVETASKVINMVNVRQIANMKKE